MVHNSTLIRSAYWLQYCTYCSLILEQSTLEFYNMINNVEDMDVFLSPIEFLTIWQKEQGKFHHRIKVYRVALHCLEKKSRESKTRNFISSNILS